MLKLETAIINSALWAAAGDAVGWISELTDAKGLERRARRQTLVEPVAWKRKIGGINGTTVELGAGTYSDDTQLRLAVSRSIRGDGTFDVDPFAKIELPVWLSYALGAGKASKAAASNLAKRDVTWFSNFFTYDGGRSYIDAGGNGAAMRIQPHVWRRARHPGRSYINDVVKDAIVTHGNMRGVCGATFHADCLAYVLNYGKMPSPPEWHKFALGFSEIEHVVKRDFQLSRFWLTVWEQASNQTLSEALQEVTTETIAYIDALEHVHWDSEATYAEILETLNALSPERRGTGINTALAAAALAWNYRDDVPESVLLYAANAIGSDTDTIATMAGALVGATSDVAPRWPVQDADYIALEARRMVKLSQALPCSSFGYPDLINWSSPTSQSDAIGRFDGQVALAGFGSITPIGKQWRAGAFAWQWFQLSFGQTVLCKFRVDMKAAIGKSSLPVLERSDEHTARKSVTNNSARGADTGSGDLPLFPESNKRRADKDAGPSNVDTTQSASLPSSQIDELTEIVIQSNFDPQVIGECLLECAGANESVDKAVGFAAIVAKAYAVRMRRLAK